ncbi:TPA: hypothetical protein DEP58_02550 [Patescibacteria group bacterium]|nr:MAG: hypothetical protein UU98_C0030G0004 [Parcubacteria group bacterium GW2011_GWD2_42_14]HCC05163.1 hypothetical protein [Patescibacteria group bacterium]
MRDWPTKTLGKFNFSDIKSRIFTALDMLYKNDAFLLNNTVHERSISHKFAEYLQQQFEGWHVDCEYNLHGINTKKLPRECNGKNKEYVYPDIVIHHRNTNDNLLVIEIKPKTSKEVNECDNVKLVEFTRLDGEYAYHLGLFVGFNGLNQPKITWYKNAKIKNEN